MPKQIIFHSLDLYELNIMKNKTFAISFFLVFLGTINFQNSFAQIDSTLGKKITVNGVCLCNINLTDLENSVQDLKETQVEEMDLGKRCISQDGRFENGKGYYSSKYPGMIFQKDDEEYISKIRLTKDFIGKLPGGTLVNMNNLLLKDILQEFPESNFKWGSRDCSDYWTYSNDTISFYLKIDTSKKPQYPLDENYYLNRPVDGIDIFISCYSIYHKSENFVLFPPDEPMYFIDSIRTNLSFINEAYRASEIALVAVYKGDSAIAVAGKDAKNGAVYITTKAFARQNYWAYFKSKSIDYAQAIPDLKAEAKVVYILNNKILNKNVEAELFNIHENNFSSLNIIDHQKLQSEYHISGRNIGVVIETKSIK